MALVLHELEKNHEFYLPPSPISQNNFSSPILRKTTPSLFSLKSFSSTSYLVFFKKNDKISITAGGGEENPWKDLFSPKSMF